MAQFDVYRNTNRATNDAIPYLIDVQTDLLDVLKTRVVIPLERCNNNKPVQTLSPVFTVEDTPVMMCTPELAGIYAKHLGEHVGSLAEYRQEIMAALDLLFSGV